MNSKRTIDENILIEELVEEFPQLVRPLMEYGIVCLVCGEPAWGTLREQAESKNITNLPEILVNLNHLIQTE